MFTVDNKFEVGQQVFVLKKEKKRIEKKQTCEVCSGVGNIVFKGYKMLCPECKGKREIVLDSQMKDVYFVDYEPHTITSIRYSVTKEGNHLRYRITGKRFGGKNVTEDMLFVTMEEAGSACEKLNSKEM